MRDFRFSLYFNPPFHPYPSVAVLRLPKKPVLNPKMDDCDSDLDVPLKSSSPVMVLDNYESAPSTPCTREALLTKISNRCRTRIQAKRYAEQREWTTVGDRWYQTLILKREPKSIVIKNASTKHPMNKDA